MSGIRALAARTSVAIAALAWALFCIWLFSFSFSDRFFEYNLPSRLPPFLAAVASAMAIPVSGVRQWLRARHGKVTRLRAWMTHVIASAASMLPFVLVVAIGSKAPTPWRPSADDAMGLGIDFVMLIGIGLVSLLLCGLALAATRGAADNEISRPSPRSPLRD